MRSLCSPNVIIILTTTSLLGTFICESMNASQRYPFVLPKCCDRDVNLDGLSKASGRESIRLCGLNGSEIVFLPKRLFPAMSTDMENVEVELRNSEVDMMCDEGQDYFTIDLVDNETSLLLIGCGRKGSVEVAFSEDNFLDPDGFTLSPGHFCVSTVSRMRNKIRLAMKTCKQTCGPQHPCLYRCCGGHQSILTSIPTYHNESLLEYCSTPTLAKNAWNPWTSNILRLHNQTRFYPRRYNPQIQRGKGHMNPKEHCTLLRIKLGDEISLALLEDGRLQLIAGNTEWVLQNFCIDGMSESVSGIYPGDNRATPEENEGVVVYFCYAKELPSLPTCTDLAHPTDQLLQLPGSLFPSMRIETKHAVGVRVTNMKNDGIVECSEKSKNLTLSFEDSKENYFDEDGWLVYLGIYYNPWEFCIRSVSQNALGLRWMCDGWKMNWRFLHPIKLTLAHTVCGLFYMMIAVVYILMKDKELVLRCSIVAFSISLALTNVIAPTQYFRLNFEIIDGFFVQLSFFFYAYGFSRMTVLCYDVWLNIAFLRPGRRSKKRIWVYVAFTFTLPTVFCGVLHLYFEDHFDAPWLGYVLWGTAVGLICLNFLFFIATAVKLWIARHSSDIKNQKKTFLMYFKLFLLVGLRWVREFFYLLSVPSESLLLDIVATILMFLHPIVLFFFLVWDVETKRYLETNYPRVKRTLDLIYGFGYPVRKCWGLCRRCKNPDGELSNGNGTVEPPHNSNHMYVHTKRIPNIPK